MKKIFGHIILLLLLFIAIQYKTSAINTIEQDLPQYQTDTIYNRYVVIKPLSGDQILLKYREELNKDTLAHRDYLKSYYDKIFYTLGFIGTLISAIIGFFGWKTRKDIKSQVREHYDQNAKDILEEFMSKKTNELSEEIKKIQERLEDQVNLNLDQQLMLRTLNKDIIDDAIDFKDNYEILSSETGILYESLDGSSVFYRKRQEISGTSIKDPVKISRESIYLGNGAEVDVLKTNDNAKIKKVNNNKCDITINLDPPLFKGDKAFKKVINCRLQRAFLTENEWWEVIQLYPCRKETFILRVPTERGKISVWVEESEVGENTDYKRIDCEISHQFMGDKIEYIVSLPATAEPMRYKVHWDFI